MEKNSSETKKYLILEIQECKYVFTHFQNDGDVTQGQFLSVFEYNVFLLQD